MKEQLFGEELKQAILAQKAKIIERMDDRAKRVANWETDWDDCATSTRNDEQSLSECNAQLRILEGDGTQNWKVVLDENGKEVRVNCFKNKWGGYSVVGNGVFASSTKALLKKTGWTEATIKVPVWTKFVSNGGGIAGAYFGSYQIVRWHTNMVTGEYVGYPD